MTWFDNSDLLNREKQSFFRKGFKLTLNEDLLKKKKIVIFEGEIEAKDGIHKIKVIYPSGFPSIAPEVLDLEKRYKRHQNPIQGNLCLPENWSSNNTGADRVEDAVNLINLFFEKPQDIASQEIDAPEPASTWYQYTKNTSVLIPSIMTDFPNESWGNFKIAFLPFLPFPTYLNCMLSEVHDVTTKNTLSISNFGLLDSQQTIKGSWIKVSEPPPFEICNYKQFKDWSLKIQPKLEYRVQQLKKKGNNKLGFVNDYEMFGIVFPEEGIRRNEYHDQWLIGLNLTRGNKNIEALLKPSILGLNNEFFQRIPTLSKLQNRSVIIIGLGSLGSSIAVELARAGISDFCLIDYDYLDAGNIVRHACDLRLVGLSKVDAVQKTLNFINPQIKVKDFAARLFKPPINIECIPNRESDELEDFKLLLDSNDIVISTVADQQVEYLIDNAARKMEKPAIFASVSNGAWGGMVFRSIPGKACLECLGHSLSKDEIKIINFDSKSQPLYVRGCGFPTFNGAGFDCNAIANLTVRMVIQTLLSSYENQYPDATYNLINWNNRDKGIADLPEIEKINVSKHYLCNSHKIK